jgi:hypothetical protein
MAELKLTYADIRELLDVGTADFEKYVSPIINLANQFAQGTRPKVVGQMTELIKEFSGGHYGEWEKYYEENYGDRINDAKNRISDMLKKMKKAMNGITEEDIESFVKDLVIAKTFIGLRLQECILRTVAEKENKDYRLASPREEAKGIDGFIGNEPVSVKPETYDAKVLPEEIKVRIITYKKTKKGVVIKY